MKPLEGIRVVDFSNVVSAPSAGQALREMGAEVFHVESGPKGDGWRYTTKSWEPNSEMFENAHIDALNGGKRFVNLNTREPEDLEKLKQMVAKCDVFLTNYREKALEGMGLDYESAKKLNPKVIMVTCNGYGLHGKRKDDPGYDKTAFMTESGATLDLMVENEDGTSVPIFGAPGLGDTTVGAWMCTAVGFGLYLRESRGIPSYFNCSLYGAGVWAMSTEGIGTQYGYKYPRKYTEMPPMNMPFKTADGDWIETSVAKNYEEFWPKWAHAFGCDDLIDVEEYKTRTSTLDPDVRKRWITQVSERVAKTHTKDIVERCQEAQIVYCRLRHLSEMYEPDEQALANKDVQKLTYPSGREVYIPIPPLRYEDEDPLPPAQCPKPGKEYAENEAVFKELGIE
jgi:crotonobetainyl-CoA:carnitine CoA-transferase CaiB-like acyl-CoA transferase